MSAASSSLIDPAVGQLVGGPLSLDGGAERLLPVLAAVPRSAGAPGRSAPPEGDPGPGAARCWLAPGRSPRSRNGRPTRTIKDALGVTGLMPFESTLRRTLQALDADGLDEAVGSWAQRRTIPPASTRRVVAVDG